MVPKERVGDREGADSWKTRLYLSQIQETLTGFCAVGILIELIIKESRFFLLLLIELLLACLSACLHEKAVLGFSLETNVVVVGGGGHHNKCSCSNAATR